ncbi:rad21 rec8 n terminal domain-containing protein [Colletotrichum musicola]|uniref:Rad21 rec8 n terminal domain-containing protein n=1 Tax=Colletotrichum musicola TaxID=2175873 RepID=A0A8H6KDD6_9PEZI|nr:rad21 rec8 n terminal domain-containing protein [Colletotrichum musicola]
MFYSHEILNNSQFGVATIWHAANFGPRGTALKKLSRKAIEDVDIPGACETITQPGPPISLRMQSHLLCGTTRIYDRHFYYLEGDTVKLWQALRYFKADDGTVPNAGQTRREHITLGDAPNFVPSSTIPQFSLDDGSLLFGFPSHLSSGSSQKRKSQSQLSPLDRDGDGDLLFFDEPDIIHLNVSSSPLGAFNFPSPLKRRSAANSTFLPRTKDELGDMDVLGVFGDDDHDGGLHMRINPETGALMDDDEDNFIDNDDLELPVLPRPEHPQSDAPVQEGPRQQEEDQIIFDADVPLMRGSPPPVAPPVAPPATSAVAPAVARAKRARRITMIDPGRTTLSTAVLKGWENDYIERAESEKNKRQRTTLAQARENAYHFVLGRGLGDVGESRCIVGVTYPLAQMYAGDGLRDRVYGLPDGRVGTPPRGLRRTSAEAFGEDEENRNVRSRVETPVTPLQSRQINNLELEMDNFGLVLNDESMPEIGLEAQQPMADRLSSSIMPWNQTPSVGRPSSVTGPNPQQSGRQLSSHRGSSLPPFGPEHSNEFDPAPGSQRPASDAGGLLDGLQSQENSQWSRPTMDAESQAFLEWIEGENKTMGKAREGDAKKNRRWIDFEQLARPGREGHVVASQAFYHVLVLATKDRISVEQDAENFRPFGTIRIGVDMTAHLDENDIDMT